MLRPLADNIVVKKLETANTTQGGIVIPEMARKESCQALVVEVGPGLQTPQGLRPLSVSKGDRILFAKYATVTDVTVDSETFTILKEGDVLAVVGSEDPNQLKLV